MKRNTFGKPITSALLVFFVLSFFVSPMYAQDDIQKMHWRRIIYSQPDEWYGSEEAIRIADNVLLYQRDVGGWQKNTSMQRVLSKKEKKELQKLKSDPSVVTTDNGATTGELVFLSKVYGKTGHEPYKTAFLKGLDYLLEAQYDNGGWPQKYPLEDGYSRHITYNDGSMVHIMEFLKAIHERSDDFSIIADEATVKKAGEAFDKGLEVILKTQYRQNGKLTVWCAQHDEITLLPAKARSYELPSLSGGESYGIVEMLMDIDNPSDDVIASVEAAVNWFEENKIEGIRLEGFENEDGKRDRRVVKDPMGKPLWARFNDLEDNRPFFCSRDGIKRYSISEISHERRNGYSWYTSGPQAVLDRYDEWKSEWASEEQGYMFSYFMGNGEDGLHFAYSEDGLKWEALNNGRSFLKPAVGVDKLDAGPLYYKGSRWIVSYGLDG